MPLLPLQAEATSTAEPVAAVGGSVSGRARPHACREALAAEDAWRSAAGFSRLLLRRRFGASAFFFVASHSHSSSSILRRFALRRIRILRLLLRLRLRRRRSRGGDGGDGWGCAGSARRAGLRRIWASAEDRDRGARVARRETPARRAARRQDSVDDGMVGRGVLSSALESERRGKSFSRASPTSAPPSSSQQRLLHLQAAPVAAEAAVAAQDPVAGDDERDRVATRRPSPRRGPPARCRRCVASSV